MKEENYKCKSQKLLKVQWRGLTNPEAGSLKRLFGHTLKAGPKTVAKCAYFLLGNVIPGNRSEGQGYWSSQRGDIGEVVLLNCLIP